MTRNPAQGEERFRTFVRNDEPKGKMTRFPAKTGTQTTRNSLLPFAAVKRHRLQRGGCIGRGRGCRRYAKGTILPLCVRGYRLLRRGMHAPGGLEGFCSGHTMTRRRQRRDSSVRSECRRGGG